jgi:3-isopropylmalate/(R)-2-methylmalate dehydratase small subunit
MQPFRTVASHACPMDENDIDTDRILPKQFLKRIERTGFGPFAFADRRYEADGTPIPDFPMNRPEHAGAQILVTGRNFGCGSSREHAPWALEDAGFRVILAPSFADIFRSNCGKIGLLCVALDEKTIRRIFEMIEADPSVVITVDLEEQRVHAPAIWELDEPFEIDQHTKHCLINGLDHIGLTLQHEADITAFEARRPVFMPTVPAR